MISGRSVSLNFTQKNSSTQVLHNASFDFKQGNISVLTGPSGAGKTTLLRCIAHLEQRYTGEIRINGSDIRDCNTQKRGTLIGFVFQNYNLFPHLSVLENCVQPLMVVQNKDREYAEKKALDVLAYFGIEMLATRKPSQLSGGQQQRVAIARALCMEPEVLLLDEPSASLDPENTKILTQLLRDLAQAGMTIVISSQDSLFTNQVADTVFMVSEGKVEPCLVTKRELRAF